MKHAGLYEPVPLEFSKRSPFMLLDVGEYPHRLIANRVQLWKIVA